MNPFARILLLTAGLVAAAFATEASPSAGVRLRPMQDRVFKTRDASNERTESWIFWLLVETDAPRELQVRSAKIALLANDQVLRTTDYTADGVAPLAVKLPIAARRLDGTPSPTPLFWPHALRIRCSEAASARIDAMRITVALAEAAGEFSVETTIPVETYTQKTELMFPFRGAGIVTNAGITNGGHRNRSGQFAIDAVGLDENYGTNRPDGSKSEHYAGWGRAILAPADGVVVRARGDRPDQPDPQTSDPKYYAPEFPNGGDPGNHVVIDHGNGEFSMLAHFQAGSLLVAVGDKVTRGQPIARLGSSGDTQTPHLHYQLQAGPDFQWSDGLPVRFANVDVPAWVRGTYFTAR